MLQTSSTDEIFSKEPKEYGATSLRCQYGSDGDRSQDKGV